MTNLSLVTIAIYLFLVLYFKDVLSTGELEEKRKADRYSPLWFGPRVGRKKRTLSDEVFRNLEGEDVDILADFIRKNPWAVIMFTNGIFANCYSHAMRKASLLTFPDLRLCTGSVRKVHPQSQVQVCEGIDKTSFCDTSTGWKGRSKNHVKTSDGKPATDTTDIRKASFNSTDKNDKIGNSDHLKQIKDKETLIIDVNIEKNNNLTPIIGNENIVGSKDKPTDDQVIENGNRDIPEGRDSASKENDKETETKETKQKRRSGIIPQPVIHDMNDEIPVYPKTPDDEQLIKGAINRNDFLNKIINQKRLEDVVSAMYNKEVPSRETIIKQGETGSHMYISAKGRYQIIVDGKMIDEFRDVRVFGELAILYNAKRLATIRAVTEGRVWVLDRDVYQTIMIRYNIKEEEEIMTFLMNNEKLNVVGKSALQVVATLLKTEFFSPGKQIVRQGDKGHKFYIIRAGTVTITKDGEGLVDVYKKGDCFGELALLKEDSRQATVTAEKPGVECLTLTRNEFIDHFGDIGDRFKYISTKQPKVSIKDIVIEHGDVSLNDLNIITTLGVGGFGRVELVQHKKKKDLVFALKYLKKFDIVHQGQQQHAFNEKNIQMACRSAFIVRMYRTFKDAKYIYFLMESCLGGDLWSLLQKQKNRRFDEHDAKFICGCVLAAFEYLHSRGFVYRDLKPENLLIAANGYIKLTDFGFAKKLTTRGKTYTFAGTPEYVAPEIVLNRGHDRAVDYWAYGIFIFEMLTGKTPFKTDDSMHMKTYNKILRGIDNAQFPSYINHKAHQIIEKLCRPIASERLGMQKGGIRDIKTHKWFQGFDWQKLTLCELSSPFKPKLKNHTDTSNFDRFNKDIDIPVDDVSGWDSSF